MRKRKLLPPQTAKPCNQRAALAIKSDSPSTGYALFTANYLSSLEGGRPWLSSAIGKGFYAATARGTALTTEALPVAEVMSS
jgi:hypothetical protein